MVDIARASPSDCALGVALPLTEDEFFSDLEAPDRDFARGYAARHSALNRRALWRTYAKECSARLVEGIRRVEALGVTVERHLTSASLTSLVPGHEVVALLAHHVEEGPSAGSIELRDGLHRPLALAHSIPAGFAGLVHLMACESMSPGDEIKLQHPESIVMSSYDELDAKIAILRYEELILRLHEKTQDYAEVLVDIDCQLLEQGI